MFQEKYVFNIFDECISAIDFVWGYHLLETQMTKFQQKYETVIYSFFRAGMHHSYLLKAFIFCKVYVKLAEM